MYFVTNYRWNMKLFSFFDRSKRYVPNNVGKVLKIFPKNFYYSNYRYPLKSVLSIRTCTSLKGTDINTKTGIQKSL